MHLTSGVQYVDVEEGEKGKSKVSSSRSRETPVLSCEGILDRMESNDVLEIVESIIPSRCMREVCE